MRTLLVNIILLVFVTGCVAQRSHSPVSPVLQALLQDTALRNAHVGVAIYDPVAKRNILSYQADKYFVPASNVKIFTTYAAMKYLKHFLAATRYYENDTAVYLLPTGDPTFLHRDFRNQPLVNFLKQQTKKIYISDEHWHEKELGSGWSWDDFSDEYMTERNVFPVYGNTLRWVQDKMPADAVTKEETFSVYSDPEVNWKVKFDTDPSKTKFEVKRDRFLNSFTIIQGTENHKEVFVPFITNGINTTLELLEDTVQNEIQTIRNFVVTNPQRRSVSSQPLDSVLRPMMYRSDNFFAEQLLLMVSEEKFGILDAGAVIDSLLTYDLAGLPQQPVWVDGSGLSRYNLFTPAAFIAILDSMRTQFGMERLQGIFPSGDSGTLKGYFKGRKSIYAKTGSMSGVVALSGYLYAADDRPLLFSVLVNNFNGKATPVRRAIERFLERLKVEGGR